MNRRSAHNAQRITTPHQPPRRSARSSHQDVPTTAGSVGVESRQKLTEASAVGQFDDLDMRVSCERCVETWTRVSPVVPDPPIERELETFGASVSLDRLAMFLRCSPQRRGQAREATPRHDDDGVSASESLVKGAAGVAFIRSNSYPRQPLRPSTRRCVRSERRRSRGLRTARLWCSQHLPR